MRTWMRLWPWERLAIAEVLKHERGLKDSKEAYSIAERMSPERLEGYVLLVQMDHMVNNS